MKNNILISALICCALFIAEDLHAKKPDTLNNILENHWSAANHEQMFFRKDPDTFRMNGKLPDMSAAGRARREAFNQTILDRLDTLNPDDLNAKDNVTYYLFKSERQTEAASYAQLDHYYPMHKYSSFISYFAGAPNNMSFLEVADYEKYLVSLADFPRYNEQHIVTLKEAIIKGHTQYCESFAGYDKKISKHIVNNIGDSVFYAPIIAIPANFSNADKIRITKAASKLITQIVIPEYRKFHTFFVKEYMTHCRTDVGITALDGGAEYYQYLIQYYTTTNYTAEQIHQLGIAEVSRIKIEMEAIIKNMGFNGDFKAFIEFLRTDPQFYTDDPRDMLEKASYITRKMAAQLPKWFGLLPRSTFDIKPSPDGGAYYVASDGSGTTSGTYFIDVKDLKNQPLNNLEALTFHEAEPGHHFQGSLAMESEVPEFRKTLYHSAYGEGWGLYAESLGKEMGFYQDPYSDFGRLSYEMWRACRLVVDTGMHAKGWSREKAINYLASNSGSNLTEATGEIDRYITWPAQALSYKIGELKIRELREIAERELGADFKIRDFHDQILTNGSLPLELLEKLTLEWIDSTIENTKVYH